MAKLRTLGVRGKNAPVKKSRTVQASDFNIAGIIGLFERKYDKAMLINNPDEQRVVMGDHINSAFYGNDAVKSIWDNLAGNEAQLYIKSHVGFNGTDIDAVVANKTITDQEGLASLITLLTDELIAYDAHDADAELGIGWAYHAGAELADYSLVDASAPKNLADCISRLNDLKAKYNSHDADGTAHGVAGSHQETTASASDLSTAIALANSLKTVMNAHGADGAQHTTAVDNVNFPVSTSSASSTPANTLKIESAYQENLDYGISGNRTGYRIENGVRISTLTSSATLVSDVELTVDSVAGIFVGDIIVVHATGATPGTVQRTITEIDETNKKLKFSGAIGVTCLVNDTVDVPGFKIKTFRKTLNGLESEVQKELGNSWCTLQSAVSEYYVENVHQTNSWFKVTDQSSASTNLEKFPDEIPSTTYLENGADGTSPSTSAHWSRDLSKMDDLPVRLICNPETSTVSIQKAGEVYCKNRDDSPIWVTTFPEDQTESQLKVLGAGYQRSDDVLQVNVSEWLKVDDPFNNAPNSPDRNIPNVGAVIGAWIRTIETLGIHYIPAVSEISILGINGIVNSNLGDIGDSKRTELAEYGVNIIQNVPGSGYRIRNFFTPSSDTAYLFANGLLMRNFIKISSEDSLQASENTPNSYNRIKEDSEAIRNFMYSLWFRGSTGNVPEGETFGQTQNDDGSLTTPDDHFEVTADPINNPQNKINIGERTIDVYFTYPTPAGSIQINVGILLR